MRIRRGLQSVVAVWGLALAVGVCAGQELAARPPMGWNSWDSYGLTVNEQQFRDNVVVLDQKLKPLGWNYAVIDEGWFLKNPLDRPHPEKLAYELDDHGRYIPVPERFPSAMRDGKNAGFAEIGRWVHAKGLKFGIHIVRGIPRESVKRNLPVDGSTFTAADVADTADACPWDPTNWGIRDNAAGQAWYDALLKQYAGWGVDLLKVDCISENPYKVSEIRQIKLAIERSGRPMVLSLSPGPTNLSHAAEVGSLAQMWRVSNDIWDVWRSSAKFPRTVYDQFDLLAAWAKYAKPGNWPDADMLPVGELSPRPDVGPGARKSRLTETEQRTMMTLWSMARSPLILGANLTLLDEPTMQLIGDRELIRIDQTAIASGEALHEGELRIWRDELPGKEYAIAVFNTGDEPLVVKKELAALGLTGKRYRVREAGKKSAGAVVEGTVAPHGSLLFFAK